MGILFDIRFRNLDSIKVDQTRRTSPEYTPWICSDKRLKMSNTTELSKIVFFVFCDCREPVGLWQSSPETDDTGESIRQGQTNTYRRKRWLLISVSQTTCAHAHLLMHQSNITYGYFWLLNHNEFYFCEQNARFTQKRKEPPKIVNKFIKIRIINHVTITMELICESLKLVFKRCTTGHYLIRNLKSLMFYTAAVLILIDKTYTTNKKFPKKKIISMYGFDTMIKESENYIFLCLKYVLSISKIFDKKGFWLKIVDKKLDNF